MQKSINIMNKAALQWIAVAAMITDHAASLAYGSVIYYVMRLLGRMTIVIMCYFIAEGYYKTRNIYQYIVRMAIFAAISQIPFMLFSLGRIPNGFFEFCMRNYTDRNVIFTLFVGLCMLTLLKSDYSKLIKILTVVAAVYLVRNSDWRYYALAFIYVFGMFHDAHDGGLKAAAVIIGIRFFATMMPVFKTVVQDGYFYTSQLYWGVVQLGGLLAIPLLNMYNGEKGNMPKMFFYIFYPAHILILYVLKLIVL